MGYRFSRFILVHQIVTILRPQLQQHEEPVPLQHLVPVDGQTDVVTMGLPYLCPYNVNSIMNPILVMCLGLGYFFNLYRGKPLVREGGVLIMSHPTPWEFHPVHHPSYIDFFEQVLAVSTDPVEVEKFVLSANLAERGPPVMKVAFDPAATPHDLLLLVSALALFWHCVFPCNLVLDPFLSDPFQLN